MTLVLLHALPLDGSMWDAVADGLVTPDGPVLAPRLYDLGPTVAGWAEAIVDEAGPGPLTLVGASVGGSCALEVARLVPDRVERIVLVGAKAAHRPDPAQHAAARRVLDEHGLPAAWDRIWAPLLSPAAAPGVVDRVRTLALAQDVDAIARGVDAFHTRPDASDVARAHADHLVVVRGADDPIVGDRPPLAPPVVVEGAGHYVPLEQPAALRAILSRGPGCA